MAGSQAEHDSTAKWVQFPLPRTNLKYGYGQEREDLLMATYRKDKVYAVIIIANRGAAIRKVEPSTIDSFIHDVVEGYFEAHALQDIASQHDLMMLVNEVGRLGDFQLNPWASIVFGNTHRQAPTKETLIYGDAVILRKADTMLEPFNKEDALNIVTSIMRGGNK